MKQSSWIIYSAVSPEKCGCTKSNHKHNSGIIPTCFGVDGSLTVYHKTRFNKFLQNLATLESYKCVK